MMAAEAAAAVVLALLLAALTLVLSFIVKIAKSVVLDPCLIGKAFRRQGLPCLPYHPFAGSIREIAQIAAQVRAEPLSLHHHDVAPYVLPHYHHWRKIYGDSFVFWVGPRAVFTVHDPELVKLVLSNKFGHFELIDLNPEAKALIGGSVASLNGERWAQHRRIIAHTAFGSNYKKGKQVFTLQHEQLSLLAEFGHSIYIPGSRFIPTSLNRRAWRLQNQIQTRLREIIRITRMSCLEFCLLLTEKS